VFGALTLLWCFFAWWLVTNAAIGKHVRRAGRIALPFVLVAVGLYILRGAAPLLRR
jgi:cadmium resistance protein CadD (predicted permease)